MTTNDGSGHERYRGEVSIPLGIIQVRQWSVYRNVNLMSRLEVGS